MDDVTHFSAEGLPQRPGEPVLRWEGSGGTWGDLTAVSVESAPTYVAEVMVYDTSELHGWARLRRALRYGWNAKSVRVALRRWRSNGPMTDAQRRAVEGHLADKYGIDLARTK